MIPDIVARLRNYMRRLNDQFPNIWKVVDSVRAERAKTVPSWPSWVCIPSAVCAGLIRSVYRPEAGNKDVWPAGAAAAILAAWRPTQGIYQFDESLLAALLDTPLAGPIPAEALLRLPEWCCYVPLPADRVRIGTKHSLPPVVGFFASLDYDVNDGEGYLQLVADRGETLDSLMPIKLGNYSLETAIHEWIQQASKHLPPDSVEGAARAAREATPLVNIALYLCSEEPDVTMPGGDPPKFRPRETVTRKGIRLLPPDKPLELHVGYRIGAALRRARDARQEASPGEGISPSPHIRRAHWHSFWTGPRTGVEKLHQAKRVKWLPPIAVLGGSVDPEPVMTVRRVGWDRIACAMLGVEYVPPRRKATRRIEHYCRVCCRAFESSEAYPTRCGKCRRETWNHPWCPLCNRRVEEEDHVIAHLRTVGGRGKEPDLNEGWAPKQLQAHLLPWIEVPGRSGHLQKCTRCSDWRWSSEYPTVSGTLCQFCLAAEPRLRQFVKGKGN